MLVPRSTCLYCEQEGVETSLIRWTNHWAFCPIHSPDWMAAITPADPDPLLLTRGTPGWARLRAA